MFLERLQLNGFKSFAQQVELKFVQGITAVVGPNGSGKSNIADAIRWVLGEQSLKTIRGKKSADVIFAGSDKKARLGMAEVSLHLNNEDGKAPIDYAELALTRRFFRSGDGEYLINNNKTRLADIQLLLAKANVGQKTYSVIGQGQIDAVLLATTAERKDFFDEATGVKQYQIKRDQALHKLERAYENMKQGKMMLGEIEPRLRMLTRQVRRLEQKELVDKELKGLQSYYYYQRWHELSVAQTEAQAQKDEWLRELNRSDEQAKELAGRIKAAGGQSSREEEFVKLQTAYEQTQKRRQELQRELAVIEGRRDIDLEKKHGQDVVWAKRRQQQLAESLATWEQANQQLVAKEEELSGLLADKQAEQRELVKTIEQIDADLRGLREEGGGTRPAEVVALLERAQSSLQRLLTELKENTDIDVSNFQAELTQTEHQLSQLIILLNKQSAGDGEERHAALQQQLRDSLMSKDNMVNELAELKSELKVVTMKKDALQQLVDQAETEGQQLQRLLTTAVGTDVSASEAEVKSALIAVDDELHKINQELKQFNQQQQQQKDLLLELQRQSQMQQQQQQQTRDKLGQVDVELARLETRQEDLSSEVYREMGVFMATMIDDWKRQVPEMAGGQSNETVGASIENLKKKREMIGGIEPEAVDEYSQVKEKYDFLKNQVKDLTDSMARLKDTIVELDGIISNQFTENFKQIGELFNKYFRMLFNGGKAELVLIKNEAVSTYSEDDEEQDEVDMAESVSADTIEEPDELAEFYQSQKFIQGIDIKATPPGKKMKGISMLSGGERALTSIALICAMIANNPSPFVVLDEVDAALDEANSLRFAEIVGELSRQTQFVIITHNRATMEKADILYGVTMGADGVSNLLSVKFEEAQEYANRY